MGVLAHGMKVLRGMRRRAEVSPYLSLLLHLLSTSQQRLCGVTEEGAALSGVDGRDGESGDVALARVQACPTLKTTDVG